MELELTIVASTIAAPSAWGSKPKLVIVTSTIAPSAWSSVELVNVTLSLSAFGLEPVNAAAAAKQE